MGDALQSGLVLPGPNHDGVKALFHKVRLLALRRLLMPAGASLPRPLHQPVVELQRFLSSALRARPSLVAAFEGLDVLVPLLSWELGSIDPATAVMAAAPPLFSACAHLSAFHDALSWDAPFEYVPCEQQASLLTFQPPARRLLASPHGVDVELQDGRALRLGDEAAVAAFTARPFSRVTQKLPQLRLSTFDSNPLRGLETHPNKRCNGIDTGGRACEQWCHALSSSLELVEVALPQLMREMTWTLRRVVPVGYHAEQSLSASYREAPGLVYVTLHPDPVVVAEALIHETQHAKLNAVSLFDPLLQNGCSEWAESPVRPDLRPLSGILLAAHAFVAVGEFLRELEALHHELSKTPQFAQRRAEIFASNARCLEVLVAKGKPTPLGQLLLDDLVAVQARSRSS